MADWKLGELHLKPLQEENKFHWSLKSLELISSLNFFLETWEITIKSFELRHICAVFLQMEQSAVNFAWTLSFVFIKKAKYIKCLEILTVWFLTEGKESSRGHYLLLKITRVDRFFFFFLPAYNEIKSCYCFTVHFISDVCLFFSAKPVNHLPSVRNEGGNVSAAHVAAPYGSVWFA